jgi:hypothetical protein
MTRNRRSWALAHLIGLGWVSYALGWFKWYAIGMGTLLAFVVAICAYAAWTEWTEREDRELPWWRWLVTAKSDVSPWRRYTSKHEWERARRPGSIRQRAERHR